MTLLVVRSSVTRLDMYAHLERELTRLGFLLKEKEEEEEEKEEEEGTSEREVASPSAAASSSADSVELPSQTPPSLVLSESIPKSRSIPSQVIPQGKRVYRVTSTLMRE